MAMFNTTYSNNIRTVTGTPQLNNNDVVLNCDTSLGAVTINLLQIPANYWNTQWRLYIKDIAGNSSTNNITINAGAGQKIDGSSSLIVKTNSAQVIIQISSNTDFVAVQSYCCGTTGIVSLTNSQLLALISSNLIVVGQEYLVTDAEFTDGGIIILGSSINSVAKDGHSFHLNADYQAVGNYSGVSGFQSQIGLWGFNDTPVIGDIVIWNNLHYKNLTGINTSNAPSFDFANWELLTKSETNGYILEIDFSLYDEINNRLISRQDKLKNNVEFSFDSVEIAYSFDNFQWGNNVVNNNKIFGNLCVPLNMMNCFWTEFQNNVIQSVVYFQDNLSLKKSKIFSGNRVGESGYLSILGNDTFLDIQDNQIDGTINFNNLSTQNLVSISKNSLSFNTNFVIGAFSGNNQLYFYNNTFTNSAQLNIEFADTVLADVEIYNNNHFSTIINIGAIFGGLATWRFNTINTRVATINILVLNNNATQGGEGCIIDNWYSDFPKVLNMASAAVFSAGVLQLGIETWIGKYLLTNTSGQTISNIQGGVFNNFQLISNGSVGDTFNISTTNISTSVAGDIIRNHGLPNHSSFESYIDFKDSLTVKTIGSNKYFITSIDAAF